MFVQVKLGIRVSQVGEPPSDMCSRTRETHILSDMCSPTWETHIPSGLYRSCTKLTHPSPRVLGVQISIGHFRVPKNLTFKARLSAKPLIWKWFLIMMQIKLFFTTKVSHLASFWKRDFLELGNGLFPYPLRKSWDSFIVIYWHLPDILSYLLEWVELHGINSGMAPNSEQPLKCSRFLKSKWLTDAQITSIWSGNSGIWSLHSDWNKETQPRMWY